MSDELDAMRLIAAREGRGLELLYDRYATMVYSLALRIVRDTSEAEDITQEVFTQLWTRTAQFDAGRGSVAAWLSIMARSRSLDRLRRRRSRGLPAGEGAADAIPDPSPSVELVAASTEQIGAARQALAGLPEEQRTTLELAYFDGLTQTEIAERTRTPLGTVKTRIRTGLQRLRDAMLPPQASPRSEA
jgi:RNA polymerase sigma-70 factor (ECF subfamily)